MKTRNHLIVPTQISACLTGGWVAVCIMLCFLLGGNIAEAQTGPAITNIFPDGVYQFENSPTISFYASSSADITNVSVTLSATTLLGQSSFPRVLTSGHGLTITGTLTDEYVTGSLTSNMLYTATIDVTDANGNTTSTNISFDTITPAYTFEAEDFDYGGGQYFDNPQTNAYAGLSSVSGVDYVNLTPNNGAADYRPKGLETENLNSDKPRLSHAGFQDYDCGWANGGNWGNYTRHYPAGTYDIYVRASNGNGQSPDDASLSVVSGTASFSGTGPYTFSTPNTGWPNYVWVPVLDASNNLAQFTSDGSVSTLRVTTDNGNYNANFYMLLPANTNPPAIGVGYITNIYPNGAYQFQGTNRCVFTVISSNGINDVEVQLQGTNLEGQVFSSMLMNGNGLTIAGSATNETVSFLLQTNTLYTAAINIVDGDNNASLTNLTFDTVSPNYYTFEVEDYNYENGQYYDNPQTNFYFGLDGVSGVDQYYPGSSTAFAYRPSDGTGQLPTGNANDVPRLEYLNTTNSLGFASQDFAWQFTSSGEWGNFTRHFPAGIYNIYLRASSGGNGSSDSASLSVVTSDPTQPNQTTIKLGTFSVPGTGSWDRGTWVPLINSGGYLARFNGGSLETLRLTIDNGNCNANYIMLVPADLSVNPPPFLSNFQPDGSSLFQYTDNLTFTVNSSVGISTNDIVLNLDGRTVIGLTFSGNDNVWNVSYPLRTNSYHTAIVTMTDSAGTTISTNRFATFSSADYQWEAEDYDYGSGQYFDNPQTNAYSGLPPVPGVDCLESDANAANGSFVYRPSPANGLAIPAGTGDVASDGTRAQFASGGTNFNIGYFGVGSWANYTRHYPAGTYNVYGRFAEGASAASLSLSQVTSGVGTSNQVTSLLGTFQIPLTGWTDWGWVPLTDNGGNLAKVVLDGSQTTLQLAGATGPEVNADFLMLVPADLSIPSIANMYPDGSTYFQSTNALSFTAGSSAGIDTNDITVVLNGVTQTDLSFSGSSTDWTVGAPLKSNVLYTAVVTVTTLTGNTVSVTNTFDTFSPSDYQWEAEDYDYGSGQYFDNPQTNAYSGLSPVLGVDCLESDANAANGSFIYRPSPANGLAIPAGSGDAASDGTRAQFASGGTNFNIGYFGLGSWANYTRHYPLGTYTVWVRAAEGNNATACTLAKVTAGVGTTNQTASLLGTFYIPAEGWTTWEWSPLLDASSNYAKVTFNGSPTTLKLAGAANDEANVDFFMLVPATPAPELTASASGGNVVISFVTQTGYTYQVLYKNHLTDGSWTALGGPIAGNDSVQSVNDAQTGTSRFYRVQVQ